jgi:hypothetical protein
LQKSHHRAEAKQLLVRRVKPIMYLYEKAL